MKPRLISAIVMTFVAMASAYGSAQTPNDPPPSSAPKRVTSVVTSTAPAVLSTLSAGLFK